MTKFTKVLALALIVAIVVGFAGVDNTSAQGKYVKTFDLKLPVAQGAYAGVDPKGTTITWWHQHSGQREKAVQAAAEKFNKENPFGITLNVVSKGSYDDIFTAVTAGIQTGELPEIVVAYGNQAAVYQNNQALVDLDVFLKDPVLGIQDFEQDMFTRFFESDLNPAHDNQRLGFSTYRSVEVLYYNVDVLTEMGYSAPPKTWEEFGEMVCRFVREGRGTDGYQIRTDASFIAAGAFAAGGDIYDRAKGEFTYNSEAAKVLPRALQKLLNDGCIKKTVDPRARSDQAAFASGAALFYTGSSSGIPFVWTAIKDSPKPFVFDVAPIPGYGNNPPVVNVYGASNSVVAKGKTPEQILASWLFLRWFSEAEQQAEWAKNTNYFPVRRSAAEKLEEVFAAQGTGRPYRSAFNLLSNTKEEPSVDVYQTVRAETSKAFNDILDGANVDERMDQLTKLANELLEASRK
ncbi:MAG: extracellular solute-binding protein [Anaerolineae bacterium]|nr:extracellular solute-binding protein [Anaerolineae bacterium]MDW8299369.1 extracellular solute-binding protein [Anaerolineae bacterium]